MRPNCPDRDVENEITSLASGLPEHRRSQQINADHLNMTSDLCLISLNSADDRRRTVRVRVRIGVRARVRVSG